jgi:transcriptional regulator with XRE-family HTH domain
MRVACNLRELRKRRGLGLRETAERAGVNRGVLSSIERGRMLPSDDQVPGLEKAYGAAAATWYSPEVLLVLDYPESGPR